MVGQVSAAGLRRQAQPVLKAVKAVAALIDIGDEGMDLGRADARQKGRGKFGGLAAAMTPPQHQQDFLRELGLLDRLRTELAESAAPILPPNLARLQSDRDYYVTSNLMALRNTRIGNLMGLCVLTLPTGVPSCGVSLMAAPREERRLLRLGLAAEAALA